MTSRSSCPACSGSGTVRGLNGPGSSGPCYACAEAPEPLLFQATDALLSEPGGLVVMPSNNNAVGVVLYVEPSAEWGHVAMVAWLNGGRVKVPVRLLYLDLTLKQCRDCVDGVVGEKLAGSRGVGVLFYSPGTGGWSMAFSAGHLGVHFSPDGPHDGIHVPALADLDPHDDTRLPDGSSRVDALALLAVAREVLGE